MAAAPQHTSGTPNAAAKTISYSSLRTRVSERREPFGHAEFSAALFLPPFTHMKQKMLAISNSHHILHVTPQYLFPTDPDEHLKDLGCQRPNSRFQSYGLRGRTYDA